MRLLLFVPPPFLSALPLCPLRSPGDFVKIDRVGGEKKERGDEIGGREKGEGEMALRGQIINDSQPF